MANTLAIRRRIKSVKNTRQITKAMEMVSATKMRRAQAQALKTRTYSQLAWQIVRSLSGKVDPRLHKLLLAPEKIKNQAVILLTSSRGLAGSFNSQVISRALDYIRDSEQEHRSVKTEIIAAGRKGAEAMHKAGMNVVADFKRADVNLKIEEILPLAALVVQKFVAGEYDRVLLVYSDFISTITQKPKIMQLLPFPKLTKILAHTESTGLGEVGMKEQMEKMGLEENFEYLFEPQADLVLERLIPRILEMQIYQAGLESNASEQSARMVAMKNATDAALDIISDLTLEYNKIRQEAITKEIAEISAGRLAVS
ncbi:MAG: ATP synthase F1 subunit gamma [bacterium]|nr:ATP synthase F1 subunit gamma [bacterium]